MPTAPKPAAPIVVTDTLRCLCVCRDPIIIISYGNPMAAPTMLAPLLAGRKVFFLAGAWWSYLDLNLLHETRKAYVAMRQAFPDHEYIFLTNDPEENQLLQRFGMPNYGCHHNAFLDERLFTPLPQTAKDLDAVYCARLSHFKRHGLARDIPSWGLVYYFHGAEDKDQQRAYLRHMRQMMPNMVPLNHDPASDAYRWLSPQQVCAAYNRARVGLCLSPVEGGNYAATEYMLCGLPVVSTRSKGGREVFLDPEISRIVEPDPAAVAQAVAELIALRLPPQRVRLRALLKLREMRHDFIRLVSALIQQEGREDHFAEQFQTVFTHKMITQPPSAEAFLAANGLLDP